ncbi:hypothetical protein ACFWNT_31870 [Streptomyces sp. NPDC058409]|uniref:hypothetical protein n=1 Tax=Streptomyces sp. NPDC058409 TaxID=3346484 RepID=UPI00365FE949
MSIRLNVLRCTAPDALFRRYPHASAPQPAYIELGLEDGVFLASYDPLVGPGRPVEVASGIDRRWAIPALKGEAANELLGELAPFAQRVLDGAAVEWDGENYVGRLITDDADEAYGLITVRCEAIDATEHSQDVLPVWDMDSIGSPWSADDAGITAASSDDDLDAIETRLLREFREEQEQPDAVVHGLSAHLRWLRDELGDASHSPSRRMP